MKLWQKGYELDQAVEDFTVGDDYILDQHLVYFDCLASLAHATMLKKIGILSEEELERAHSGLKKVWHLNIKHEFKIEPSLEDCHTAIENFLIKECGQVGKKIHTARSRNDQVLVALRLYMKRELLDIIKNSLALADNFVNFAESHREVAIPGRTHMQLAMPSSFGLWAGALAESILDDIKMLEQAFFIVDQCPLGSAAGYGSSIEINRELCASLLGFREVQNNVLYASNSRGKLEIAVMHALFQLMLSLSKASSDLMFYSLPEIAYIKLPEELCSGSSLMPQKRNPDALELLRAKSGTSLSLLMQVSEIIRALPSGYHRDFQETKGALIKSFSIAKGSLIIIDKHIKKITINMEKCQNSFQRELFATDEALRLSQSGIAFREAYQKIAQEPDQVQNVDPKSNILSKTHRGATGNLGLLFLKERISNHNNWLHDEISRWSKVESWFLQYN